MPDLPAMLRVAGRRCVIIGGGAVAKRRAAALLAAGATVIVIAPDVDPEFSSMKLQVLNRPYRRGDMEGALLAVIATDDASINMAATKEAQEFRVLVNRCDDPEKGDVSIPAHSHHGPVTIAVETGGASPAAAGLIRRELSAALDPAWPRLLEAVAPFRAEIQKRYKDPAERQDRLREMTSATAMQVFKTAGMEALLERCRGLVEGGG